MSESATFYHRIINNCLVEHIRVVEGCGLLRKRKLGKFQAVHHEHSSIHPLTIRQTGALVHNVVRPARSNAGPRVLEEDDVGIGVDVSVSINTDIAVNVDGGVDKRPQVLDRSSNNTRSDVENTIEALLQQLSDDSIKQFMSVAFEA